MDIQAIKDQIRQTATNIRESLSEFDLTDEIRERIATLIDQKLDELGARIGSEQPEAAPAADPTQAQAQPPTQP